MCVFKGGKFYIVTFYGSLIFDQFKSLPPPPENLVSAPARHFVNCRLRLGGSADGKNLLQFLGQNNVSNAAANALMMQRLLGTGGVEQRVLLYSLTR